MLLEKIFHEDVNGHDTPPLPINPSENKKISDMVADLNTVLDKAPPPLTHCSKKKHFFENYYKQNDDKFSKLIKEGSKI